MPRTPIGMMRFRLGGVAAGANTNASPVTVGTAPKCASTQFRSTAPSRVTVRLRGTEPALEAGSGRYRPGDSKRAQYRAYLGLRWGIPLVERSRPWRTHRLRPLRTAVGG